MESGRADLGGACEGNKEYLMEKKMNVEHRRSQAVFSVKVLNQIMGDIAAFRQGLVFVDFAHKIAGDKVDDNYFYSLNRMHWTFIGITLFKVIEVRNAYQKIMPKNEKRIINLLADELNSRKVNEFRNKFCGHILCRDSKTPISEERRDEMIGCLMGGTFEEFVDWLAPSKDENSSSVIGMVQSVRNSIMRCYEITEDEI